MRRASQGRIAGGSNRTGLPAASPGHQSQLKQPTQDSSVAVSSESESSPAAFWVSFSFFFFSFFRGTASSLLRLLLLRVILLVLVGRVVL